MADCRPEDLISEILAATSDRDRELLTRFYLKKQSPVRICSEMGVSQEYLRSAKAKVKARLDELRKKTRAAPGS
jgi:DNA-directed RNA polymerase specialized sigma24 family protein